MSSSAGRHAPPPYWEYSSPSVALDSKTSIAPRPTALPSIIDSLPCRLLPAIGPRTPFSSSSFSSSFNFRWSSFDSVRVRVTGHVICSDSARIRVGNGENQAGEGIQGGCLGLGFQYVFGCLKPNTGLIAESDDGRTFMVYNRWGRVGVRGQDKLHGPYTSQERAINEFQMKFFDKTKNQWSHRKNFTCYPRCYTWLEMDYSETEKETVMQCTSTLLSLSFN